MGKVTYGDFNFPKDFGFSGSSAGRADAKSHPQRSSNEYGGGLKKGGAVCMAKGGPIKKAGGGPLGSILQNPIAQAVAQRTAGALAPQAAAPAANPMMQPAVPPSGMAKGGKFIGKAIKRPGRMKTYAKKLGVSVHQAEVKASHSKDPSLRGAGALGLRLTGGDLKPKRKG